MGHKEVRYDFVTSLKIQEGKYPMLRFIGSAALVIFLALFARPSAALETLSVVLTSKAFQYVPLVIAQERGYMREEGLELKFVFMQNAPGLQALSRRGGVPVFSRPHEKPNDFSDSARSLDGGSPARPAGFWSRPT